MSSERERTLVEAFKSAKGKRDEARLVESAAQEELNQVEQELLELMQAQEKESTARYEGLGFVSMNKPVPRASCSAENKEALFAYLKKIGREDMIKTDVHSQTLSTFVKETLLEGVEPPKIINYFLQTKLRFYPR